MHDRDGLFAALLVPGAPAYVPRTRPTTADAIAAIHAAGGVAVWAHPYWDEEEPRRSSSASCARASTASSASTPRTPSRRCARCTRACRQRGLLITGSADFHGPEHERFGGFRAFSLYGLEPDLGPIAMI